MLNIHSGTLIKLNSSYCNKSEKITFSSEKPSSAHLHSYDTTLALRGFKRGRVV